MLGQHPKFKEIAVFEAQNPYYSKEELEWISEYLKDLELEISSRCTRLYGLSSQIIRLKTNGTVVLWILMF